MKPSFFSTALLSALVALSYLSGNSSALAQDGDTSAKEKAAREAADRWLTLVDTGQFGDSWSTASNQFKSHGPVEAWAKNIVQQRSPLGRKLERKLRGTDYTRSTPGFPPGEYVMIVFEAQYANKPALDIVTCVLEDGRWKVTGYAIRPNK